MGPPVLRSVLLAAALTLLVGSAAFGVTPTRSTIPINDSSVIPPGGNILNPCTQSVSLVVSGTLFLTDYFDQSGNFIRELATTPRLTYMVTGPTDASLTGLSPASSKTTINGDTLTAVFNGAQFLFLIPGTGNVLSVAGQEVLVIDLATGAVVSDTFTGQRQTNVAAYCSYLGAN